MVDYYCMGKYNRIFILEMTCWNKSHAGVTLVQLLLATMGHLHYCSVFAVEISTKPMTSLDPRHLTRHGGETSSHVILPVNSLNAQLPQTCHHFLFIQRAPRSEWYFPPFPHPFILLPSFFLILSA